MQPDIKVTKTLIDENTGEYKKRITFLKLDGSYGRLDVDRGVVGKPHMLHAKLIANGAVLNENYEQVRELLKKVISETPKGSLSRKAHRTGWRSSGAFVRPTRILGKSLEPNLLPPSLEGNAARWPMKRSGTLKEWKDALAVTKKSSAMTFAAAIPFAAATLELAQRPSFGFLLHGKTKRGKSTATLICASAIGIGNERSLPSFGATKTALLNDLPVIFNDLPLAVNELGAAKTKGAALIAEIDNLAYSYSQEASTTYSDAAHKAGLVSISTSWRTVFLFNSEKSAREIASDSNSSREEGAKHRLCDLPLAERFEDDAFDLCTKPTNRGSRTQRRCKKLRDDLNKNNGWAIDAFVKKLLVDRNSFEGILKSRAESFLKSIVSKFAEPDIVHLAGNFAHVYAAGSLAIALKILPYTDKHLRKAVRTCFSRAAAIFATDGVLLREGLKTVNKAVRGGKYPPIPGGKLKKALLARGYVDESAKQHLFVMEWRKFKTLLPFPRQAALVLAHLSAKGRLDNKPEVPAQLVDDIRWATTQKTWPDKKTRLRSIVIAIAK